MLMFLALFANDVYGLLYGFVAQPTFACQQADILPANAVFGGHNWGSH